MPPDPTRPWHTAPDAAMIEGLARAALAALPAPFTRHLGTVAILIDDVADDAVLAALGIDDAYELTGLYTGQPLGHKSVEDSAALPDTIHLYRLPILVEWIEGGEDLAWLVRHVLVHEIGHHFGLSDADMHAIEDAGE